MTHLIQQYSVALQVLIGLGDSFKGLVNFVQSKAYFYHVSNGKKVVVEEVSRNMEYLVSRKKCDLIKIVSEVDDKLAEAFSSDKPILAADLEYAICRATIAQKFVPVFMVAHSSIRCCNYFWMVCLTICRVQLKLLMRKI